MTFRLFALAFVIWVSAPIAQAQVVVSELGWAGSDLSTADEWLEISPLVKGESLSLSGWTLHSLTSKGDEVMLKFGAQALLTKPFVVSNYAEPQSRLSVGPDWVTTAVALPNTDLHLQLRRPDGTLIDDVVLGSHPAGSTGAGGGMWASAERIDPLRSGADPANWQSGIGTEGFDMNAPARGTPGIVSWLIAASSSSSSISSTSSESSAASSASSASESSVSSSSSISPESSSSASSDTPLDGAELVTASSSSSLESSSSSSSSVISSSVSSSVPGLAPGVLEFLRITEVMADPVGSDDGEWIEVANLSSQTLPIDGVLLQRRGFSRSYRFVEILGSGGTLMAGQHLLVPREKSLLTLPNDGGEIVLTYGETTIDSFVYPAAIEGVSSGRLDGAVVPFCTATPGRPNRQVLPEASLLIQGGALSGVGRVSLNVAASLPDLPGQTSCRIDFGDGSVADSCNPPTHVFSAPGSYSIHLTAETVCGEVQGEALTVSVTAVSANAQSSSSAARQTAAASSSGIGQRSCSPSAATGVFLSGALPNPVGDDEEDEEIRLRNVTMQLVDLCGWVLDDGPDGSKAFRLDGTSVAAGAVLVLKRSVTGLALNNTGDVVRLFRPGVPSPASQIAYAKAAEGEVVGPERVAITVSSGKSIPTESDLQPYLKAKSPPQYVSDISSQTIEPGQVVLSEIFSHPAKGSQEWIEVLNGGDSSVDLSGWLLDDDPASGSPAWLIPHGTLLEGGGTLVFEKAQTKLSLNDGGDSVELRRGSEVVDRVDVPALKGGVAFARADDGSWCQTSSPTPGEQNACEIPPPPKAKAGVKKKSSTSSLAARKEGSLLASLKGGNSSGNARSEPASVTGSLGLVAWLILAFAAIGAAVWGVMQFQDWRWKLQPEAK